MVASVYVTGSRPTKRLDPRSYRTTTDYRARLPARTFNPRRHQTSLQFDGFTATRVSACDQVRRLALCQSVCLSVCRSLKCPSHNHRMSKKRGGGVCVLCGSAREFSREEASVFVCTPLDDYDHSTPTQERACVIRTSLRPNQQAGWLASWLAS